MGKKTVLRFAFELDGDDRSLGLRLPGWRVLSNGNDVYVTTKPGSTDDRSADGVVGVP